MILLQNGNTFREDCDGPRCACTFLVGGGGIGGGGDALFRLYAQVDGASFWVTDVFVPPSPTPAAHVAAIVCVPGATSYQVEQVYGNAQSVGLAIGYPNGQAGPVWRRHSPADSAQPWRRVQSAIVGDVFPEPTRGIYVGTTGDVVLRDSRGGFGTFVGVPSGTIIPGEFVEILSGTASDFVAGF